MTFGSELSQFNTGALNAIVLDRDGVVRAVDLHDITLKSHQLRHSGSLVGSPFACFENIDDDAREAINHGVGSVCRGDSDRFCYRFALDCRDVYELVADHKPAGSDSIVVTYQKLDIANKGHRPSTTRPPSALEIYKTLFDHVPVAILFHDIYGVVVHANPKAEALLCSTIQELQKVRRDNLPWRLYDDDLEPLPYTALPWMACLATGEAQEGCVFGYEAPGERVRWASGRSDWVTDEKTGEHKGVITTLSDITQDRDKQFELESQAERTYIAVENADMGVWDWVPEGNEMIWDKKMFQLYGYPDNGAVVPQDIWPNAVHKEDVERVLEEIRNLLTDNRQKNVRYRAVWPDGSVHYLSARAKVIRNDAGRVVRMIGVTHDVTNEVMAERKLWDLAYTDHLTGTYSRAGLNFRMSRTIARSLQTGKQFCVLMMGLARFKEINENYGLAAGDKILKEVSQRAKAVLETEDTVARVGGDEFALVLESLDRADKIANFIVSFRRDVLHPVLLSDGLSVNMEAAIGVSVFPEDGYDTSSLQTHASLAMHNDRAKESPSYMQYSKAMSEEVSRKFNLKYQLYRAVKSEEFELYYQPIVDLDTRKVIGCEALIRWRDNEGKFVSPMEFIPVVEESGLIYELGLWINQTAARQWKLWQELVPEIQYISVNVSPRQLENLHFVDELVAMAQEHKINPKNLQLEITEGTFLQDSLTSNSTLRKLASHGFRLAIDDFGTGYSSLAYLKRFNVDVIKIDRSFITDIEKDESDRSIVSAILAMNRKLGFKTLVEGIETDIQHDIVQSLGCDSAQGYLYGRPTFADEFAELYIPKSLEF